MNYFSKICVLLFTTNYVNSLQLTCVFKAWPLNINTIQAPSKEYFECEINHARLLDLVENVTIKTDTNTRSNNDVELVEFYIDNIVKVIPNVIFKTFPNCTYLYVRENFEFEELKKTYFDGALKLKTLWIPSNDIRQLDKKVFASAPNIEIINLLGNKIENFHRLAFDGLSNLQQIYLQNNRIHQVNVESFTSMTNLKILDLSGNYCIDRKYQGDLKGLEECDLADKIKTESVKASQVSQNVENIRIVVSTTRNLVESLQKAGVEPLKNITTKLTNNIELLNKNSKNVSDTVKLLMNMFSLDNAATLQVIGKINERVDNFLSKIQSLNGNQQLLNQTQLEYYQQAKNSTQFLSQKFKDMQSDIEILKSQKAELLATIKDMKAEIKESIANLNATIYRQDDANAQAIEERQSIKNNFKVQKESLTDLKNEVPQLTHDFHLFMYTCLGSIGLLYIFIVALLYYAFKVFRAQEGLHKVRYSVNTEKTHLSIDTTADTWAH